jgi:hypothetical protein
VTGAREARGAAATAWDRNDAWIFLAATMRGPVDVRALARTADHLMHAVPEPEEISATVAKLLGAGLMVYDGTTVRSEPPSHAMAQRARASTASPWAEGGAIDRALAELERWPGAEPPRVPGGYRSWYGVIAEGRRGRLRHRLRGRA